MPYEQITSTCTWWRFAPKGETVRVSYKRPDDKVVNRMRLVVLDSADRTVFQTDPPVEGAPAALTWDGECNQAVPDGTYRSGYVHPLYAPYTLRVEAEMEDASPLRKAGRAIKKALRSCFKCPLEEEAEAEDEAPEPEKRDVDGHEVEAARIRVLYHHIELKTGLWLGRHDWDDLCTSVQAVVGDAASHSDDADTAVVVNADLAKWLQVKLNKLGYFAGLVDGDPGSADLLKAIKRYNHAHVMPDERLYAVAYHGGAYTVTPHLNGVNDKLGRVTRKLIDMLDQDEHPVDVLDDKVFENAEGAPGLAEAELDVASNRYYIGDEFDVQPNSATKSRVEALWLTQPCFPLRAKIWVEDHAGAAQRVAEAVGPVGIKWTWEDEAPSADGINDVLQAPSRTDRYVGQAHAAMKGAAPYNNTSLSVGGPLAGDDTDRSAVFEAYPGFDGGGRHARADHRLFVKACDDPDADATLRARSYVWLRTSAMGGDNYKVTAAISLDENDPETVRWAQGSDFDDFRQAHQGNAAALKRSSGKVEVWRTVRIAAYVRWSNAADLLAASWADIADEYRAAFLKLLLPTNLGGVQISGLTNAETEINAAAAQVNEAVRLAFSQDGLVSVPTAPNGASEREEKATIMEEAGDLAKRVFFKLAEVIDDEGTAAHGQGLIPVNWSANTPVSGNHAVDFVAFGNSFGASDGVCFIDQEMMANLYDPVHLAAHEIGHNLFLQHWKNARPCPADHDQADENCIMSYIDDVEGLDIVWYAGSRFTPAKIGVKPVDRFGSHKPQYPGAITVRVVCASEGGPPWNQNVTDTVGDRGSSKGLLVVPLGRPGPADPKTPALVVTVSCPGIAPIVRNIAAGEAGARIEPRDATALAGVGAHYRPGHYHPHFCGKCNLKLRGWDITAAALPDRST